MMKLVPCVSISLALAFSAVATAASYDLDCSFPIHNKTLNCGDLLGDRQSFYEYFMDGCREEYTARFCDDNEDMRIKMNIRQPQSMVNYTAGGFRKIRAPESLMKMLTTFYEKNTDEMDDEEWSEGNIYTNHWEAPTYMLRVGDDDLEGGGSELEDAIWEAAKTGIEDWTTMRLRPSSLYGIRVYTDGAVLNPHVDRIPLISSAIINVAQDVDEDWPLEVYDRFGNAVNITMEVGDIVFYESHSLIHGRPFALKGRYYANVFVHFEPIDAREGDEFDDDRDSDLPPYLVPDSPEAENWLADHPHGWSKEFTESEMPASNDYASQGNLKRLKELAEKDPKILRYSDDNGWQPLHEAIRGGHFEVVKFLIEQEVDMNARTYDDKGPSPLNLAKHNLGFEHPIYLLLSGLGAKDIEDSWYKKGAKDLDHEEEDWEDKEEWEDDEWEDDDEWDEENEDEDDEDEDEEDESANDYEETEEGSKADIEEGGGTKAGIEESD